MKQTIKKGFTLVELLFVMAIISILAGFAIANLNDSTRVAVITSMKNDARANITNHRIAYNKSGSLALYECSNRIRSSQRNNGLCNSGAIYTGDNITVFSNSTAPCGGDSYLLTVTHPQYTNVSITFDSCLDGGLQQNVI